MTCVHLWVHCSQSFFFCLCEYFQQTLSLSVACWWIYSYLSEHIGLRQGSGSSHDWRLLIGLQSRLRACCQGPHPCSCHGNREFSPSACRWQHSTPREEGRDVSVLAERWNKVAMPHKERDVGFILWLTCSPWVHLSLLRVLQLLSITCKSGWDSTFPAGITETVCLPVFVLLWINSSCAIAHFYTIQWSNVCMFGYISWDLRRKCTRRTVVAARTWLQIIFSNEKQI